MACNCAKCVIILPTASCFQVTIYSLPRSVHCIIYGEVMHARLFTGNVTLNQTGAVELQTTSDRCIGNQSSQPVDQYGTHGYSMHCSGDWGGDDWFSANKRSDHRPDCSALFQCSTAFSLGCFWGVLHPPIVHIYPSIRVSEAATPPIEVMACKADLYSLIFTKHIAHSSTQQSIAQQ